MKTCARAFVRAPRAISLNVYRSANCFQQKLQREIKYLFMSRILLPAQKAVSERPGAVTLHVQKNTSQLV
jgi:hypothetical protein